MSSIKINSTGIASTHTSLSGQPPLIRSGTAAQAVSVMLFGKRPPRLLDKRKYPHLKKLLRKLGYVRDEIAEMLGRSGDDLPLELCEGYNACIDRDGQIALGLELLEHYKNNDDVLIAILAHEIGHQPWDWPQIDVRHFTRAQISAIAREEEAKADFFSGKVLADLDASPHGICKFLIASARFEQHHSPDYYPADVRAAMIKNAYDRRNHRRDAGRAIFGGQITRALR